MRALAAGALVTAAVFGLVAAVAGIEGDSGTQGTPRGGAAAQSRAEARDRAILPDPAPAPAEVALGRELFARMGCGSCHALAAAGTRGEIGPDLDERLPAHDRASLVAAIVSPPTAGSQYSGMPENFGERMNARELDSLAAYLLATRGGR